MNSFLETKPCPACSWPCSIQSQTCPRCHRRLFPAATGAPSHWTGSSWTVVVSAGLAFFLLVAGGFLLFAQFMISQVVATSAFQEGLRIAQASPEVQKVLGDRIKVSSPAFGSTSREYGSQFVEWKVALSGSHSSGDLNGVANELNGKWEFSRLTLISGDARNKIDLAPKPRRLSLPPVPAKKVYLIPFDLDADESLDWAPAYYQAKLGVDVSLLPAMRADESLIDPRRRQLDSEKCVNFVRKGLPDLVADPSTLIIAVTSRDIFIRSFGWAYTENFRQNGRFAVVSSARLKSTSFWANRNPEWSASRLQKMLTKNIAMLYFDLPMSNDYTSLLSGGVLSGDQVDFMSGSLLGAEGRWDPFAESREPEVTIYDLPDKPALWRISPSDESLPDTSAQVFNADLALGLFVQRQTDFQLAGKFPLQFVRVYRNQDEQSRSFGIGANDSLDIFLVGEMGSYGDLILADGGRIRFDHSSTSIGGGDTYLPRGGDYASLVYKGDTWTLSRNDGWKFYMPYRPKALPQNVTVLTGFSDPAGNMYRMDRDSFGDLLSITTPSGEWLHFQRDSAHRVQRIQASNGRAVDYKYDSSGCLSQVTDSENRAMIYTYDDHAQMQTVSRGPNQTVLTNTYDIRGNIKSQTMADGQKFEYHYAPASGSNSTVPDLITAPNGLLTHIRYGAGSYTQSLPVPPPH